MSKNEGEKIDKDGAGYEGSGDHTYDMNGKWEYDNANSGLQLDLGDSTNFRTLYHSKSLTTGRPTN